MKERSKVLESTGILPRILKPVEFWALTLLVFATACGPSITQRVRYEEKPYNAAEFKQTKDGITVENQEVKEFPANFFTQAQACNASGAPLVDANGGPAMRKIQYGQVGQTWYKVAITNNTEHVVRLNGTIMRLFDPAANNYEPLSREELDSNFLANFRCPSGQFALNQFRSIKLLDRNQEILPHSTLTGWLAFKPASMEIPGIWKLAVYEVPTATDEAGKVTRTARFEMRILVKKFIDTYEQKGPFSSPERIKTKEVSD